VLILFLVFLGFFVFSIAKDKVRQDLARPIAYPTATIEPAAQKFSITNKKETESLFVPYWTIKQDTRLPSNFDQFIYFGITPGNDGIDRSEPGFLHLADFASRVPAHKQTLLALRMIDQDTNFALLKDPHTQQAVIVQTIAVAREHGFDGIMLDLEVSAIPFDSLIKQITSFTTVFSQEAKKNKLTFSLTMYGDVFYRLRPFDVQALSQQTDTIMIMAYDFSKAKGNPGPNFPLHGSETYGYDLAKMTDDFLRVVPPEKLTVIFGHFGYDWIVDGQGKALQQGKALTEQEIEKKFIQQCQYRECRVRRDTVSAETAIHYTDDAGVKHSIWFEDAQSVAAKKTYLKERGITSFSSWAYSYF